MDGAENMVVEVIRGDDEHAARGARPTPERPGGVDAVDVRHALVSLSRDVEVALVRITQEALTNVLRHRGPGRAWVGLATAHSDIALTGEDDGPSTWISGAGEPTWHRAGSPG